MRFITEFFFSVIVLRTRATGLGGVFAVAIDPEM